MQTHKTCHCGKLFEDRSLNKSKKACSNKCRRQRRLRERSPRKKHRRSIMMRLNAMRHNCHSFRLWHASLDDNRREQVIDTYIDKLIKGRCELCGYEPGITKHLHIDHDHRTGTLRGLLCHRCNVALGYIESFLGAGISINDIKDYTCS